MEKKNMVLLTVIAVATLLVAVVGATFAYFTATVQDNRGTSGDDGTANITAGSVASSTIVGTVEGTAGEFEAENVYPGHKEIAAIEVKANNENGDQESKTSIAIKYDVTQNTYKTGEIKVSVYRKDDTKIESIAKVEEGTGNDYFNCKHVARKAETTDYSNSDEPNPGTEIYFEECEKDYDDLTNTEQATLVGKSALLETGTKEYLFNDTITANQSSTKTVYYYVVVEFVNQEQAADKDDEAQNASMNATLEGNISVIPA